MERVRLNGHRHVERVRLTEADKARLDKKTNTLQRVRLTPEEKIRLDGTKQQLQHLNGNGHKLIERVRLPQHKWQDLEPWTKRVVRQHAWRTLPFLDVDDLYQEAYLIFRRCKERYPRVLNSNHFFALYSRAFTNHVTDLTRKRTRSHQENGNEELLHNKPHEDPEVRIRLTEPLHRIKNVIEALERGRKPPQYEGQSDDRYWSRLAGFSGEIEGISATIKRFWIEFSEVIKNSVVY